ncbi:hypothetical protein ACLMJK_007895 [Lecanora helva]
MDLLASWLRLRQGLKMSPGIDLGHKHTEMFNWWINQVEMRCGDDRQQVEVVQSLRNIPHGILAVVCPPGTRKTCSLASSTIALALQGYKALVVGPPNKSVEQAANSVWNVFPGESKENITFLYYGSLPAELRVMPRAILEGKGLQDLTDNPETEEWRFIEDEMLYRAMASAVRACDTNSKEIAKLVEELGSEKEACEVLISRENQRNPKVPWAMTLNYHLFRMTLSDQTEAKAMIKKITDAWKAPKMRHSKLAKLKRKEQIDEKDPLFQAYAADAITQEEVDARVKDGRIPAVHTYDKSHDWVKAQERWLSKSGDLNDEQSLHVKQAYIQMVQRVFAKTDILFTTSEEGGTDFVALGFEPRVLVFDNAEQINFSSLAFVMSECSKWLALLLFGDPKQLPPHMPGETGNEFRRNAELSALELLQFKVIPTIYLDVQYRMAKSIAHWPISFLYENKVHNHPKVLEENQNRQVARLISKEAYKIKGENGNGSEYWVINVMHGCHHGALMFNDANAEAIAELVDRFVAKGCQISDIVILTYYKDQKQAIFRKLRAFETTAITNGRKWDASDVSILYVDDYQDQKCPIVILDFVAARVGYNLLGGQVTGDEDDSEDDEIWQQPDKGGGRFNVPAHLKDARRLCRGLTRSTDALIIFAQTSHLLKSAKLKQRKDQAALSDMVKDAVDRGLVYNDINHMDNSPEALAIRKGWSEATVKARKQDEEKEQRASIAKNLRIARKYTPHEE